MQPRTIDDFAAALLVGALIALVASCGDNLTTAPDAGNAPAIDAGVPSCASLREACALPQNLTRECASGGACFCDVGTKAHPMPIRCAL